MLPERSPFSPQILFGCFCKLAKGLPPVFGIVDVSISLPLTFRTALPPGRHIYFEHRVCDVGDEFLNCRSFSDCQTFFCFPIQCCNHELDPDVDHLRLEASQPHFRDVLRNGQLGLGR